MIALSDRVFGWDDDYDVLFDASLEAIRADPWPLRRGASPTRSGTSSRSGTRPRCASGPSRSPSCRPSSTIDGKPFPAPITVSPLVQAVRYGFVWCPTDDLERCVVPDPAAALGERVGGAALPRARRHGSRLERAAPDARLERLAREQGRNSERPLAATVPLDRGRGASRSRSAARAGPRRSSSSAGRALLVLLVHALSQAPQNEFELPVRPRLDRSRARRAAARRGTGRVVTRIEIDPTGARRARRQPLSRARRQGRGVLPRGRGGDEGRRRPALRLPRADARPARGPRSARATGTLYFPTTSDAFFERHGDRLAPFDVVFVDGLHTYEQSYRDVRNALAVLRPRRCRPRPRLQSADRGRGRAVSRRGRAHRRLRRRLERRRLPARSSGCGRIAELRRLGARLPTRAWPSSRAERHGRRVALTVDEIERLGYAGARARPRGVSSGSVRRATSTGCSPGGARH